MSSFLRLVGLAEPLDVDSCSAYLEALAVLERASTPAAVREDPATGIMTVTASRAHACVVELFGESSPETEAMTKELMLFAVHDAKQRVAVVEQVS